jgi:Fe-S cluster assembly protein SufD
VSTEMLQHGSREAVVNNAQTKNEPEWLVERRLSAWEAFERLPMPSRSDEEWRRTDIRPLKLAELRSGGSVVPVKSPLDTTGSISGGRIIQDNLETLQRVISDHVRDLGVTFCSLDEAVREHPDLVRDHLHRAVAADESKFVALNSCAWAGGVFVHVPKGVDVALPLTSLFSLSGDSAVTFPRTLIVLEEGAQLTYIEEYASDSNPHISGPSLSNGIVEIFLGQGSHLTLVTLQEYLGGAVDINTQRALLDREAVLDWLVVGLGDGLTKSNIEVAMQGPGARTQMLGVLWGYGSQHTDYHTLQDHQAPNCSSDLLYKAALTDEAVSVFSGRIRVEKGAHRTDSYQANRTVILSEQAAAFPSPNLEIEANDVRCTHGASVGKVDAEQLFYLMSRGLRRDLATKMIVEGFLEEVLEREPAAAIREDLSELLRRKIEDRAQSLS